MSALSLLWEAKDLAITLIVERDKAYRKGDYNRLARLEQLSIRNSYRKDRRYKAYAKEHRL